VLTFKDLKKTPALEATQEQSKLTKDCKVNHFGSGMLMNINKKTKDYLFFMRQSP
jgi:hypothetical protein